MATASGDMDSQHAALLSTLREARDLQQILAWIENQPFDPEDVAQIAAALSARRVQLENEAAESDEPAPIARGATRAHEAGWLEWQMVNKPTAREFGPYVYCRSRKSARKRP
jgi:hypothetical protein